VLSAEEAIRRLDGLPGKIGITRLADITGLDQIGIPVYSAVVPRSRDLLSVYNGKSTTRHEARIGAIMEAAERFLAWSIRSPDMVACPADLQPRRPVLAPEDTGHPLVAGYSRASPIGWVEGFDLLRQEEVLVPRELAGFNAWGTTEHEGLPCVAVTSTNGLASGFSLEEAVCHGLCEVIERDALTLADVLSHRLPRFVNDFKVGAGSLGRVLTRDDVEARPSLDARSVRGLPCELLDRFGQVGLRPHLKDLTSDLRIPTFLCSVVDESAGASKAHLGLGCHPDTEVALTRALTEAAQSRAADIQGVREDIIEADSAGPAPAHPCRRVAVVDRTSWFHRPSVSPAHFDDVPSHRSPDVFDDIQLILANLAGAGLESAIVVDLSREDLPVHAVRVIIPGLESWNIDGRRFGERAVRTSRERVIALS